ncbi:hypothetical protein ABH105_33110, partial [Mycolicibacterium smegmatis]
PRPVVFIGGTAPDDAPAEEDLLEGDYWLPVSEPGPQGEQGPQGDSGVVTLSQSEFDALSAKDPNTVYVVVP